MPRSIKFADFLQLLSSSDCRPRNLCRFMDREKAESFFSNAVKKERFNCESLFSYYFCGTWVEFVLYFDEHSRLRRLYVQHRDFQEEGVEISLNQSEIIAESCV